MAVGRRTLGIMALLLTAKLAAHHSPAMLYDLSRETTIEGTVTEYTLGNPHMRVYLDVEAEDGSTERWMAEGGSRTVLMRKGWDGSEVEPGDVVSVRGHPSRDGSRIVHLQYLILPDGTELFGEDLDTEALEDLRRRDR